MDDLVQGWSNPRIEYFTIWHLNSTCWRRKHQIIHWINHFHFFDPMHGFRRKLWTSTYLSLDSHIPTSKRGWWKELVEMNIRNLQPLLVCTIILWRVSLTKDDWIFGWRSGLASQILILFLPYTFLHCGWMKRLFGRIPLMQFLRIKSWWRCRWICKNVSRYTMCVSQMLGGPSLRLSIPLECLNIPSGIG